MLCCRSWRQCDHGFAARCVLGTAERTTLTCMGPSRSASGRQAPIATALANCLYPCRPAVLGRVLTVGRSPHRPPLYRRLCAHLTVLLVSQTILGEGGSLCLLWHPMRQWILLEDTLWRGNSRCGAHLLHVRLCVPFCDTSAFVWLYPLRQRGRPTSWAEQYSRGWAGSHSTTWSRASWSFSRALCQGGRDRCTSTVS